jgi:16S rRNA (cytosine1402-N4)-methyltransferase
MNAFEHVTVLKAQAVDLLLANDGRRYVDATLGGGGHAEAILDAREHLALVGVDQDPAALEAAARRLQRFGSRVDLVAGNFRELASLVPEGFRPVDGVLFDLGVSSPQLDDAERGFAYQADAPLDMRMNPLGERSAFRLVNWASVPELTRILREYGEERWAHRIARFIADARTREPIRTTGQLVDIVKAAIPAAARRTGGHPARRTFQAIRIWVNEELDALDAGLDQAYELLGPRGRLVVISFHSLEDRLVKHRFRAWREAGRGQEVTKKPIVAGEEEQRANPRSRSAKLRAFERR